MASEQQTKVLVFGDLTNEFDANLRSLTAKKDNALLKAFLDRVVFALRAEIGLLASLERESFVRFSTFEEILNKVAEAGSCHPALRKALTCTSQFGSFISHFTDAGKTYPTAADTRIVGLCTGLLTGSAISCCQSMSDLVLVAVHTVIIAFRTGLCASEVGSRVEPSADASASWSYMIPGLAGDVANKVLESFSNDKGLPVASRPYISAYADNGVTLSGPPSVLEELLRSKRLPRSGSLKIKIPSPYHAAHLYKLSDVDNILKSITEGPFARYERKISVASSINGKSIQAGTYAALMRSAVTEILLEPLYINKISERLANELKKASRTNFTIMPVGTLAAQTFVSAFRKAGLPDVGVDNSMNKSVTAKAQDTSNSGNFASSKLAIIAYSGRYPDAANNEEFWNILHEGRDIHSVTPATRWDVNTHVDPSGKKKNTSGTPYGCWLKDPGFFDARFFSMSPREAPQVDPAQRLLLMTTYEAIENAGIVPDATPSTARDRVGVFCGTTSNDWGETNSSQNIDTYYIPGSCRAFIPGRSNYYFKFSGPSYSVDTACSSSLSAMHVACNALWQGDVDTAISSGTNVMTNPDITAGLDRGHFLSRTGNCKTFDDGADGYCRGEGVCTVIIKRLEDAIADNDPILGLILGSYVNHSAEAESITRPHVGAQKDIFKKVLTKASVDPSTIGYVEMHGTGTQAGDAREMESVLSTFASETALTPRSADQKLYIGSAKSNVGHGESVSGIIALIKVLMMMEKNEIPRHVGIKTKINTIFPKNLAERNIHIAMENTPWLRPEGGQRRAFINNFSAAGGNSSLLVGDAPIRKRIESADPRTTHMVAVTAKSTNAIVANMKSMIRYIEENNPSLASLSYTTTARRAHHPYRVMVNGSDLSEITAQLKKAIIASEGKSWPRGTPTVAFAFTGQGSQYVGMARELLQFSRFRKDFERFDAIAQQQGFPALMPLLSQTEGDILDFEPLVVQLASTCMQMAMARLWQSWGIEPIAVVGHSLGEYAALNVAGVLSDSDTIFLTGKRAQLLQEKCTRDTHAMLAVRASVNDIHKFLDGMTFEIACKNGPTETVLSGTNTEIDRVYDALSAGGFKQTRLRVPYAFHSSQVQTILEDFEHAARSVIFHAPKVPVISPLLGEVITEAGTFSASYLSRHCREAVNFAGAIAAANTSILKPTTVWVELGPHPVVGGLVKTNLGNVTVLPTCQRSKDTWKVITSSINTLYTLRKDIKFIEYHHDFKDSVEALKLPAYNWDLENYWMQYVNDWSLYKGDAKFLAAAPPLSTTSVQRIVEEKHEDNKITLVSESDLAREDLDPMCRGHRVNGVALCTPSVYADIALTLGEYIRKQRPEWKDCLVDVQKMDVQKPLVAKPKGSGPQLLRCRVLMFCATPKAAVEFYTVNAEGKKLIRHAECYITYPNAKQARDKYQNNAVATLGRMDEIRANLVHDDRVQKLNRSTSYKMVESLASYDEEFKGVEECILDSANLEAVSRVRFLPHPTKGDFFVNPHLIDNFGQPALFTMNANDTADLEKEVFVNHGWTSLQFYKPVSMDKTYHSYVKMSGPKEDGMYDGDMVIYEGSEVVAAYIGVKAQGVPRRLMDYIVKMKDDSKPTTKAAPPVPAVAVIDTSAPVATAIKTTTTTIESTVTPIVQTDSWNDALNIISEESGVPVSELTGDTAFADLGVDSLLSLLCASRFREELGLDYESHIFVDNSTVKELETFWKSNGCTGASTGNAKDAILNSMFRNDNIDEVAPNARGLEVMQSSKAASSIGTESPSWNDDSSIDGRSDVSSLDNSFEVVSAPTSSPPTAKLASTSLFLQGSVSAPSTKKTLFMLPDGSGSASSYAAIPRLDPSIAVVGLNCPFMKIPEHYNVGIDKVAALYISEIRRRQPNGPYAFGGWSVGGIFAYHVAQQLVAEGETVTDLILIDCPVPEGLDHLPKRYYEYCDSIGLLGEVNGVKKAPPPWLIKHFEMCVDSLHSYYATPFPATAAPRTHIIWACDSIDKHIEQKFERRPDDTLGLNFLVESRTDFGPCGWETLLPRDTINISASTGANHFSMMKGEHGKKLGKMIAGALLRK